jgi:hypothetical protein
MATSQSESSAAPSKNLDGRRPIRAVWPTMLAVCAVVCQSNRANADEGGVSMWVPGFFGSLAAAPQVPGFAFGNIFIHPSVAAGADVAFARQVHPGNITANFTGKLDIAIQGKADLYLAAPTYTFASPLLGGQAQVALAIPYGRSEASVDATLTGNLGLGGPGFTIGGSRTDAITGFGDLAPMFNLRWNSGVNNYMTYITGNIPVGRYDPDRLANLGLGHQALDAGAAYTYFNPQTANEFSATLGFTYNFENTNTQYQSGIDMHLDLGASKFVTKQLQLGAVGYLYQQLTCDSGAGDRVGCFESRVAGIGPQIGYIVPLNEHFEGYFNLKGYKEFAEEHRAAGWNVWLTFAISPKAQSETSSKSPLIHK